MLCEIPIPEGWEFVGYRSAEAGEYMLDGGVAYQFEFKSVMARIIIRKQWQPPNFLPDGWIAMDRNGMWNWYERRPTCAQVFWAPDDCKSNYMGEFIWERPPVTDWKESLREIKRDQAQPKVAL